MTTVHYRKQKMHWQLVTNVKHCDVKSFCKFFFFLTLLIYLNQGGQLELSNEFFHEVKPGLSSYADNPKQVSTEVWSKEKKKNVSPPPPPLQPNCEFWFGPYYSHFFLKFNVWSSFLLIIYTLKSVCKFSVLLGEVRY